MSESLGRVVEGVFAINKPPSISSAQVIREVQNYFASSRMFAPQLAWQLRQAASQGGKRQRRKRQAEAQRIKIGHGGTLDPLATGVLVLGVGRGTKHLNNFIGCTKTYETVVLFGKSTDTYDVAGKVVSSAPHGHITKALVEAKLADFRGKINQVPPIYSALRIDGMKAYDYARSGKELPRAIAAREMEVEECEMLEWFEGGEHEYRWPATEATIAEKQVAQQLMTIVQDGSQEAEKPVKRKFSDVSQDEIKQSVGESDARGSEDASEKTRLNICSQEDSALERSKSANTSTSSPTLRFTASNSNNMSVTDKARLHTHEVGPLSPEACAAPAARIRLTASSGFYVRSFAHDLGIACGSLALMANLVRSRQGNFDSSSAVTYYDLKSGEDVWGPKLQSLFERWNGGEHSEVDTNRVENSEKEVMGARIGPRSLQGKSDTGEMKIDRGRRNTSSGEE